MLPASARRSGATATAAAAAVPPSPAASSTTCSPTRSSSAASAIATWSIPASTPPSWTRASGRRCRSGSPPTGSAAACGRRRGRRARWPAGCSTPRAGRCGRAMRASNGRRYRYYVSADLVEGSVATGATGWRIPAAEIEAAVARTLAARLRDPGFLSDALGHAPAGARGFGQGPCRHRRAGRPARCAGIGCGAGNAPAARHPGRALGGRAQGGSALPPAGGDDRWRHRSGPGRVAALRGHRTPAAAAPRTGAAPGAAGRGGAGTAAGPAPRAHADRGAQPRRRLARPGAGAQRQRHRPARRRRSSVMSRARCSSPSWRRTWWRASSTAPNPSRSPPSG